MLYHPDVLLVTACVIVNPQGGILLLERKGMQGSGRFEVPGKDINFSDSVNNIGWRRKIIEMVRKTTRMWISQLDTSVYLYVDRKSEMGKVRFILCAGVACSVCASVQVDYDDHAGYTWVSQERVQAGNISVTTATDTCVEELYSELAELKNSYRGGQAW